MRLFAVILLAAAAFAVACGGESAPPTSVPAMPGPTIFATALPAVTLPAMPQLTPTATPTPAPQATATPAPQATATPVPTPTPEPAAPAGTPGTSIIAFPTATPAPTTTPAPTATPAPTPRPGGTAGDPDICYRTPHVQYAILDLLNVNLCVLVSPRELFRIGNFSISNVLHPDDLAGFANLHTLHYRGPLDHLDLTHTPELRGLYLNEITNWPNGFVIPPLPRLETLRIEMRGEAACQIFRQGAVEQIFGNLMGRLHDIADFQLEIRLPYGIVPDDSESRHAAEVAIANALEYDVGPLTEKWMENQYGEEWREYLSDNYDRETRDRILDDARASVVQQVVDVSLYSSAPRCQP